MYSDLLGLTDEEPLADWRIIVTTAESRTKWAGTMAGTPCALTLDTYCFLLIVIRSVCAPAYLCCCTVLQTAASLRRVFSTRKHLESIAELHSRTRSRPQAPGEGEGCSSFYHGFIPRCDICDELCGLSPAVHS
uniref:Uncharacterized protein n=1 Tax=Knipowitschia caucasica TaxID=637954 RepID=A0AAV2J2C6_KNICA